MTDLMHGAGALVVEVGKVRRKAPRVAPGLLMAGFLKGQVSFGCRTGIGTRRKSESHHKTDHEKTHNHEQTIVQTVAEKKPAFLSVMH